MTESKLDTSAEITTRATAKTTTHTPLAIDVTEKTPTITAVIVARNESLVLANCLDTLRWCDEILVIDSGSTDETAKIAETLGARVISFSHPSMAKTRNEALKRVRTDWLLYVDADERVTPTLAKEILVTLETANFTALRFKRQNVHYGQIFRHGGWNNDLVTRAFRKDSLTEWYGDIHESPRYEGEEKILQTPLIHLTHRNTIDGLHKTIAWTPIEAELLYKADTQPVSFLTILRKGIMEFFRRAVLKGGYRDGMAGWIESLIQGVNRMLVYIQVWELQRQPSLTDSYQQIEQEISNMWRQES